MIPRTGKAKTAETLTDMGLLGSAIIVGAWALREFGGVEVPADVQLNGGVLLMVAGGALARLWRHWRRYGRGKR